MNISKQQLSKIYVLLAGILYSTLGYLGISLFNSGITVNEMLFWRFFLSAMFFTIFFFQSIEIKKSFSSFLIGALLYAPSTYLWFVSIKSIGAGLGMVIFFSFPIYVALLSAHFNKQKFTRIDILTFTFMMIGLVLIADLKNNYIDWQGLIYCIISAILYGIYFFVSKKVTSQANPISSTTMVSLGNAFIFMFVADDLSTLFVNKWHVTSLIIIIAIIGTALPILLVFKSIIHISETQAAILSVSEPIFSLLISYFIMSENLNLIQFVGIILIIASSIIVQLKKT